MLLSPFHAREDVQKESLKIMTFKPLWQYTYYIETWFVCLAFSHTPMTEKKFFIKQIFTLSHLIF